MAVKPTIPSGTRDFSPEEVYKRQYIFNTIRSVFEKYGYQPIETPTMENLLTLEGKYGEEGDRLLFRITNSGYYLGEIPVDEVIKVFRDLPQEEHEKISKILDIVEPQNVSGIRLKDLGIKFESAAKYITEKGLRYDLTVPFARYVVMHQNEITFPFKRYQIQPVFRADRPQRGRYREFYQCDADVVGSNSLLNEVELIQIYFEVFKILGLDVKIRINNRKILSGIAEKIGAQDKMIDLSIALDKYDNGGMEKVKGEMRLRGFSNTQITSFEIMSAEFMVGNSGEQKINLLKKQLSSTLDGIKGTEEIDWVVRTLFDLFDSDKPDLDIDISLARGLNYYTGAIIEVNSKVGSLKSSIGGGGRYDNLTGVFGLKGISGVGISFGADRIYDVMEELKLFPKSAKAQTRILFVSSIDDAEKYSLQWVKKVRDAGFAAEIYPFEKNKKDPKHIKYALSKKIPLVAFVDENGTVTVRNMETREQKEKSMEEIIQQLK